MTPEQINAEIKEMKKDDSHLTKFISDGYHTFEDLYNHRCVLTAALFRQLPFTWKSRQHADPENNPMFDGMFIVGVVTPDGCATYHYNNEFWDMFKVPEIPHAPEFDGHTPDEALERIKKYFTRGILQYNSEEIEKLDTHLAILCDCFETRDQQDIYMRTFIK